LPDDDLVIPAADLVEPDEPIIIDIGDKEPDLIDMSFDDDAGSRGITQPGIGVAEDIVIDVIGEGPGPRPARRQLVLARSPKGLALRAVAGESSFVRNPSFVGNSW
jgi:hypothetical protein